MTVFTGIKELLTLQGAAQKQARRVQESDLSIIQDAAMVEDRGRIVWVGEKKQLKAALAELRSQSQRDGKASSKKTAAKKKSLVKLQEIDLKAEVVMPAFLECHTHLIFAGDRQHEFEMRNQGATYQDIAAKGGGIRYTVKQTSEAPAQQLLQLAEKRAQKFLKQGVTTVEVKSGYGLSHDSEIKILEVARKIKSTRIVSTYLGAHAFPKDRDAEDYMNEMLTQTLPLIKKRKLADRVDMFIEQNYYSLNHAIKYFQKAAELGLRITAHVEQMTRTGAAAYLTGENIPLDSVDHLVQINDDDIQKLASSKATCVLLPTSDFYLRMKYPPARQLIDQGACVALSTDFNPGTSPTQDLSLTGVLARLEMKMSLPEVITAYTLGAAHALHLQSELGSLEIGKQCDFVVLNDSWRQLFYQVGQHPVSRVFRAGKCTASLNLKKT